MSTFRALRFVAPLLAVVGGGSGCRNAPFVPAPPAALPPPATAVPPERTTALTVPAGWRELRWGMSQHAVDESLLGRHPEKRRPRFERLAATAFPWFVPAGELVTMPLDKGRFSQWHILDLDEGAKLVEVWFDNDQLMAVRAEAGVEYAVFVRKATATYGGEPTMLTTKFVDPSGSLTKDVYVWRGDKSTVLIYDGSRLCEAAVPFEVCPRPTVLVISDHARVTIGTMIARAHDAAERATAASKAAAEQATRF